MLLVYSWSYTIIRMPFKWPLRPSLTSDLITSTFFPPAPNSFFFFWLFLKGCRTTSPCPRGSLCQRCFSPEIHFPFLTLHHLLKGFAQMSFPSGSYLEHPFSCCSCCLAACTLLIFLVLLYFFFFLNTYYFWINCMMYVFYPLVIVCFPCRM